MPGRAKCPDGCDCEKHSRSRMSPEAERIRQGERARKYYETHRDEVLERERQLRRDPVAGEELRRKERERKAAWSPEERERARQQARNWYRKNPRSPEENAEAHFRHRYGLSTEQRDQMVVAQKGLCYLCDDPLPGESRKIHTDHDRACCPKSRSCGKCVRGIACEGCNTGIGLLGDDPDRIRRIADSLEKANVRTRSA